MEFLPRSLGLPTPHLPGRARELNCEVQRVSETQRRDGL